MDIHRFSSRKRKQVRKACLNCQKAHSGCGEQRPCPRCVKRKEEHKCVDAPRRKRKDQPIESDAEETSCSANNKRKRKLSDSVTTSAAMSPRGIKVERHKHSRHEQDDDYDDDACCSSTAFSPNSALAVRHSRRTRRHSKLQQPATSFTSNSALAFPFDMKVEQKQEPSDSLLDGDFVRCYTTTSRNTTTYNSNNTTLGVMGQLQQSALSQKMSSLHMPQQQQQQPIAHFLPNEAEDCPSFLFNPHEFDCVVPPERQLASMHCEQLQQPPQQQHPTGDDLSLEWLVPELYLLNTTTTTTTISAPPYMWAAQEQQQQQLPSSFLLDESGSFSGEDTPLFFSDYRTFEPLFSF